VSLKSAKHRADIQTRRARERAARSRIGGIQVSVNNVQKFRERLMMSKAELARKAGLSTLTIDRLEAGRPCRLDTKRKVLLALGLKVSDKDLVFSDRDDDAPVLSTGQTENA
jgi:DNA-binding XRE family transcriptional regulator